MHSLTKNQKAPSYGTHSKNLLNEAEKQTHAIQSFKNRGYSTVTINTKPLTQADNSQICDHDYLQSDHKNYIPDLNRFDTEEIDQSMLSEALSTKKEDYLRIINQLKDEIKDIDEARIQQIDTLTKIIEGIQKDYQEFILQLYKQKDQQLSLQRQKGWKQLQQAKLQHQHQVKKMQRQWEKQKQQIIKEHKNVSSGKMIQNSNKISKETQSESISQTKDTHYKKTQNILRQQQTRLNQQIQKQRKRQKELQTLLKSTQVKFQKQLERINKKHSEDIDKLNKKMKLSDEKLIQKYQEQIWSLKSQNQTFKQERDQFQKERVQIQEVTEDQIQQLSKRNTLVDQQLQQKNIQHEKKLSTLKQQFQYKIKDLQRLLNEKEQIIDHIKKRQTTKQSNITKKKYSTTACNTQNSFIIDKQRQNEELNNMLDKFFATSHMELQELNQILNNYQQSQESNKYHSSQTYHQQNNIPSIKQQFAEIPKQQKKTQKKIEQKKNYILKSNNKIQSDTKPTPISPETQKSTPPPLNFSQFPNQIVKRRQIKINQLYGQVKALKASITSSLSPRNMQLPKSSQIIKNKTKQLSLKSETNRQIVKPTFQQLGKQIIQSHEKVQMLSEIEHLKAINQYLLKKLEENQNSDDSRRSEPYQSQNIYLGNIYKAEKKWGNQTPQVEDHFHNNLLPSGYSLSKPKKIAKSIIVEEHQNSIDSPATKEKIKSINTDISQYKLLTPMKVQKKVQDLRKIYRAKEFSISQASSQEMLFRKVHLLERENQLFQDELNVLERENIVLRNRVKAQMKIEKSQQQLKDQVRDLKNQMRRSTYKYKSNIYNNTIKPFDTGSVYSHKSQEKSECKSHHLRNPLLELQDIPSQETKNFKHMRSKISKITAPSNQRSKYQSSGNLFETQIDDFDKFMKRTRLNSVVSSILSKN